MNIDQILKNWTAVTVEYKNYLDLSKDIPRQPGLYKIATNASKEILQKFGRRDDKMHYNLNKKITESELLPDGIAVTQEKSSQYVVYSGHNQNLRQRFREHFRGSKGTGCLALFQLETLRNFEWSFQYINLVNIESYDDSKLYRTFLEQYHRAHIGWPILCSQ